MNNTYKFLRNPINSSTTTVTIKYVCKNTEFDCAVETLYDTFPHPLYS